MADIAGLITWLDPVANDPFADIHWGRSKPQAQSAGVPPDERARHDRVLLLAIVNACKMIGE